MKDPKNNYSMEDLHPLKFPCFLQQRSSKEPDILTRSGEPKNLGTITFQYSRTCLLLPELEIDSLTHGRCWPYLLNITMKDLDQILSLTSTCCLQWPGRIWIQCSSYISGSQFIAQWDLHGHWLSSTPYRVWHWLIPQSDPWTLTSAQPVGRRFLFSLCVDDLDTILPLKL